MVDGVAKLMRDDYCDGLGDCLPVCPTGAIRFIEREAAAYDEQAVLANKMEKHAHPNNQPTIQSAPIFSGCPGSRIKIFDRAENKNEFETTKVNRGEETAPSMATASSFEPMSQLAQWPIQIKLAPTNAPYFSNAKLLIAADCTAFAYAAFHERFMKGHITLIGCPKLDNVDYSEKLTEIIRTNDIKSVTIVRMEVPCCGGLENATVTALKNSGKFIPWQVVTISTDGRILD